VHRRAFIAAAGSILYMPAAPSDQIRVGIIGSGGRGQLLMKIFMLDTAVRMAAVADVFEPNLEAGLSLAKGAKAYRNYQDLLADKEIDVVIIATPEHWHHQMLLDALAAGKDVYIEKPLCQHPEQGVELMDAARQSKSIVQVGMQRRSYDLYLQARDIRASGALGSVRLVRSWWINNNLSEKPATELKGRLDWEQWQGPAQHRAIDPDRFYHWRGYSDYSGGIMADQGAHIFDGIHLIQGVGFPSAVNASAGRVHSSNSDTPETVIVTAEYPEDFVAVFTINYAGMHYPSRLDQLNQFDGDRARLDVGREFVSVYSESKPESPESTITGSFSEATNAHVENFLNCVRTRTPPNAPVEKGFQAVLVTQLANQSLRLGRRIRWNASTRRAEA
jgi:predicted dehydrogenase